MRLLLRSERKMRRNPNIIIDPLLHAPPPRRPMEAAFMELIKLGCTNVETSNY